MVSKDFLFELGCEELPSAAVKSLSAAMRAAMEAALDKAQLTYESLHCYAAPRRLVLFIKGMIETQAAQQQQRRGPSLQQAFDEQGQPSKALQGFMRSCGTSLEQLSRLKTDKGEWMVFEECLQGRSSSECLSEILPQVIHHLPVAKPMRWGDNTFDFVRPVHWLLVLWGDGVLPMELFGIHSDRYTRGHRFHANHPIAVAKPSEYLECLRKAKVMADFEERRNTIIQQVQSIAKQHQAEAIMPDDLLDEVTSIVEWPRALMARFDENFLEVPSEALIASMQEHQKCFAMKNDQGVLLSAFITVTNIDSTDESAVVHGNEKVMRARLSDAAFFFNQDKKTPLFDRIEETKRVKFQDKLGSLFNKSERMARLMLTMAEPLALNPAEVKRMAQLSKCDLMTGMVLEFPELQGLMGSYYAENDGESQAIADALNEQYMPRFAKDALPLTLLGKVASLADRLDTLVGIFAIGQKPTGDKDPFKCRRHALAVCRLLLTLPQIHSLQNCLNTTLAIYGNQVEGCEGQFGELKAFILDRLISHYSAQQVRLELIQAVLARQDEGLFDFDCRLRALQSFVSMPEADALAAACKRVDNILRQNPAPQIIIDEKLMQSEEEIALYQTMKRMQTHIDSMIQVADYESILQKLAELKDPIDRFFDTVMVMVEEQSIRDNRLALLQSLQHHLKTVADISLLSL